MNKIFVFFLIIIFLNNCSFNSKSKFWTNEKNIKQEIKKNNIKELFTLEEALQKELNPDLEIKLIKLKLTNDKTNQNNNSINKYSGNLEKISKFKFSKIEYFDQYEPEIIFEKENIIFFDNKCTIIKFDKNSYLILKKIRYKQKKKLLLKKKKKNKSIFIFFQT